MCRILRERLDGKTPSHLERLLVVCAKSSVVRGVGSRQPATNRDRRWRGTSCQRRALRRVFCAAPFEGLLQRGRVWKALAGVLRHRFGENHVDLGIEIRQLAGKRRRWRPHDLAFNLFSSRSGKGLAVRKQLIANGADGKNV